MSAGGKRKARKRSNRRHRTDDETREEEEEEEEEWGGKLFGPSKLMPTPPTPLQVCGLKGNYTVDTGLQWYREVFGIENLNAIFKKFRGTKHVHKLLLTLRQ
jgi:hypothetical protein